MDVTDELIANLLHRALGGRDASALTVDELKEMLAQAYQIGFDHGHEVGYLEGQDDGL